jgi:gluconolactonase
MRRIVGSQQDAEELGSGFGGQHGPAEGPVWWKEGGYLLFSDIHASRRMKWQAGAGISIDREGTANANGQTRDAQGRLVACHHFSRCVDRLEADGSVTVIADRYRGLKLNRPNDVVVKSDGSVYFSDPPPRPPLTPPEHTPELDIAGVYRVSPDLKEINMIVRDFVNPNGLCFSPDEKILYINDSNRHRKLIRAYDVEGNGMLDLGSERLFCDMKGDDRPGGPDGMKCDVEGNVYCTGPGGIWVLSPDGEHLGTILQRAVNLNWGDDDWQTLYFTGPTTLHRIRLNIPGIPVPRGAV